MTEPPSPDVVVDRSSAQSRDAADPLAWLLDEFVVADPDLIYLDGNSLGRLPKRTRARLAEVVDLEWGSGLVRSWHDWVNEPYRVGDLLGSTLLGATPGQVLISDNTTTNLYKLASAALDDVLVRDPQRRLVVTDRGNFPTDRYVLEGLASARGLDFRLLDVDPIVPLTAATLDAVLDERLALVSLSLVDYRSAALADLPGIERAVARTGAAVVWDLSHAVGAVPVDLDASGASLAVGCTYKYVNAGPGAPAFLYVRAELQERLRQPIWGWFGQRDQFEMGEHYSPLPGIGRHATGTPPVLGVAAVAEGVALLAEAGIDQLRRKSIGLTEMLLGRYDAWLSDLGFELSSPRDPALRGSHLSLAHPEAYRISRALIAAGIVPDFRGPDRLRLGIAPATTSYTQVWDAMDRLRSIVAGGEHLALSSARAGVT